MLHFRIMVRTRGGSSHAEGRERPTTSVSKGIDVIELLLGMFLLMLMRKDSQEAFLILLFWLVIQIMLHLGCGLMR